MTSCACGARTDIFLIKEYRDSRKSKSSSVARKEKERKIQCNRRKEGIMATSEYARKD